MLTRSPDIDVGCFYSNQGWYEAGLSNIKIQDASVYGQVAPAPLIFSNSFKDTSGKPEIGPTTFNKGPNTTISYTSGPNGTATVGTGGYLTYDMGASDPCMPPSGSVKVGFCVPTGSSYNYTDDNHYACLFESCASSTDDSNSLWFGMADCNTVIIKTCFASTVMQYLANVKNLNDGTTHELALNWQETANSIIYGVQNLRERANVQVLVDGQTVMSQKNIGWHKPYDKRICVGSYYAGSNSSYQCGSYGITINSVDVYNEYVPGTVNWQVLYNNGSSYNIGGGTVYDNNCSAVDVNDRVRVGIVNLGQNQSGTYMAYDSINNNEPNDGSARVVFWVGTQTIIAYWIQP
jgi:hypothetical protein